MSLSFILAWNTVQFNQLAHYPIFRRRSVTASISGIVRLSSNRKSPKKILQFSSETLFPAAMEMPYEFHHGRFLAKNIVPAASLIHSRQNWLRNDTSWQQDFVLLIERESAFLEKKQCKRENHKLCWYLFTKPRPIVSQAQTWRWTVQTKAEDLSSYSTNMVLRKPRKVHEPSFYNCARF